jgi:hypothetical protein
MFIYWETQVLSWEVRTMRAVVIGRWEPAKFKEVSIRFFGLLEGDAPSEILSAYKKITFHAFEFPSAFGQNCVVMVCEADELTLATFARYWADVMSIELIPSVPFEVLAMRKAELE